MRLTTDASNISVGYILSQKVYDEIAQKKLEKVICYGGRSLTDIQSRYTITELELFACLHGITKLDSYLRGRKFILITDHAPLKWLFNKDLNNVKPRLARWIVALQMYNFEVEYSPGKNIPHVDWLSRVSYNNAESKITFKNEPYLNAIQKKTFAIDIRDRMTGDNAEHITLTDIKHAQCEDMWFRSMYTYLKYNKLPGVRKFAKRILDQHQDYMIINDTLYDIWRAKTGKLDNIQQLCIPYKYRHPIMKAYHDQLECGHFGHIKTLDRLQQRYFWNGMSTDTTNYIKGCTTCAEANSGLSNKAKLKSLPIAELPFAVVHIDILALSTMSSGYKYIVLLVDSFSKFTIGKALRRKTSKAISTFLFEDVFLKFGFPHSFIIKSDNGLENRGSYTSAISALLGVKQIFTTPYTPQSNGQVELFNRTLLSLLMRYCKEDASKWSQYLQYAIFAMNNSRSESSKYSPIMLTHGLETRTALDLQLPQPKQVISKNQEEAHEYWMTRLNHVRKLTKENLEISKELQKIQYDKTARENNFQVNDKVFLKEPPSPPHTDPKLRKKFTGPWTITKVISPTNVMLIDSNKKEMKRSVHVNKLKLFKPYMSNIHSNMPGTAKITGEKPLHLDNQIPTKNEDNEIEESIPTRNGRTRGRLMDNAPDESFFDDIIDPENLRTNNTPRGEKEQEITNTSDLQQSTEEIEELVEEAQTDTDTDNIDTDIDNENINTDAHKTENVKRESTIEQPADDTSEESSSPDPEQQLYEPVKRVLRQRQGMEGKEYYVNWKNQPAKKYNSWVKDNDLNEGLRDEVAKRKLPESKPKLNTLTWINQQKPRRKLINNEEDKLSPWYVLGTPVKPTHIRSNTQINFSTLIDLYKYNLTIIMGDFNTLHGTICSRKNIEGATATYYSNILQQHIMYWTIQEILFQQPTIANKLDSLEGTSITMRDDLPGYTTLLMIIREQRRLDKNQNFSIDHMRLCSQMSDIYGVQCEKTNEDYITFFIESPTWNMPNSHPSPIKCNLPLEVINKYICWSEEIQTRLRSRPINLNCLGLSDQ